MMLTPDIPVLHQGYACCEDSSRQNAQKSGLFATGM